MLRINFDVTSLQGTQLTGIGNYVCNLINTFQKENLIRPSGTFKFHKLKKYPRIKKRVNIPIFPLFPYLENLPPRSKR